MKKSVYLVILWILTFVISGCEVANIAESSTVPPSSIAVSDRCFTVDEINSGIQAAFHNALYYHKDWNNGNLSDKILTYDLFFSLAEKTYRKPQVFIIVTNVEHPLSTEEMLLRYIFSISVTTYGLQSDFYMQGHISAPYDDAGVLPEGASYLGSFSLDTGNVQQPVHQKMSDQWTQQAEAALRLYMEQNDFYWEQEKNLQAGNYTVYIQGFSESDVDTTVVFEHENGQVYVGKYCFVHNIPEGQQADLNHVALVENMDSDFVEYLDKIRQNAALSMEYAVAKDDGTAVLLPPR